MASLWSMNGADIPVWLYRLYWLSGLSFKDTYILGCLCLKKPHGTKIFCSKLRDFNSLILSQLNCHLTAGCCTFSVMGKDFGGSSPSTNPRQWLCAALGERCGTEWMPSAPLQGSLLTFTKVSPSVTPAGRSSLASGRVLPSGGWKESNGWQGGEWECTSKTHWYLVCTCSPFLWLFFVALLHSILLLLRRPTCFTDGVISAEVSLESQGRELSPVRVSVSGQNLSQCCVSVIFLMPGQGHKFIHLGDTNSEFQHFRGFAFANIQAGYCVRALVACSETWH